MAGPEGVQSVMDRQHSSRVALALRAHPWVDLTTIDLTAIHLTAIDPTTVGMTTLDVTTLDVTTLSP